MIVTIRKKTNVSMEKSIRNAKIRRRARNLSMIKRTKNMESTINMEKMKSITRTQIILLWYLINKNDNL